MFQCGFISRYVIIIFASYYYSFLNYILSGNEQDYIIVSLVRSWELGFLTNLRRTNVMLTRCKKGMFIVSSQKFLSGKGSDTLVGTLLKKMGTESWLDMKAVEEGNF